MTDQTPPSPARRRSLIGRLRFPQKLTLLSLVFVVPAIVAIAFLIRFTQEQIDFAEKEKLGTAVIAPLGDLALTVQRHGGALDLAATTGQPRAQDITALRQRAGNDITEIDRWMAQHGGAWRMADDWAAFKAGWQGLQRPVAGTAATAIADAHLMQLQRLTKLVSQASDVSNITLDPEMAAYMMGDTAVNNIPTASANHHRARAAALAGLAATGFSPESRTRLQSSEALLSDAVVRSRSDTDKAIAAQPSVKLSVDTPMRKVEAAQLAFSGALDQLLVATLAPEELQARSDQVYAAGDAVMSAFNDLHLAVVKELDRQLDIRLDSLNRQRAIVVGTCVAALLVALLLAFSIARNLIGDVGRISDTVNRVNQGDYAARVRLGTADEIGNLANAFDTLLDQRVATLQSSQQENEQLNNSVIDIMTSVAQLAQRDLTVRVPVSEDVTGAVSDAINMMTGATARALREVNTISAQVSDSSTRVKARADSVLRLADEASDQANAASAELGSTANALRQIGEQAQDAGREAERALTTTAEAMTVVRATVEGITASRDQIRETEKRVKRLAERSQEISSAVTIIGQIAERTSVLALNASMQAVAAGEAGRGFAVVADEVKRLAENAREATQQIAGLVNAIQSDTTETLQAMNGTISQVVDITRLADRAGTQMSDTRAATEALVNSVRTISQATRAQAETSQRLLARANELIDASQRTLVEIEQQRGDTDALSASATALVQTVGEFRLPSAT